MGDPGKWWTLFSALSPEGQLTVNPTGFPSAQPDAGAEQRPVVKLLAESQDTTAVCPALEGRVHAGPGSLPGRARAASSGPGHLGGQRLARSGACGAAPALLRFLVAKARAPRGREGAFLGRLLFWEPHFTFGRGRAYRPIHE